jgi:predicted alpha/beta superfamily hydrolase
MRFLAIAACSASLGACAEVPAQPDLRTEIVTVESLVLGQTRPVTVYLPTSYPFSDDRYPVLLVLDGDESVAPTAAAIVSELSSFTAGKVPELIVVAVPNIERSWDLTPPFSAPQPAAKAIVPVERTGGALDFLRFLETELLPVIDVRFRTWPVRYLAGHSYGGLFGLVALIERPTLFSGVIAGSPSAWYDDFAIVQRLRASLAQRPDSPQWLFVSAGAADHPTITTSLDSLVSVLEAAAPPSLSWRAAIIEDEDHTGAQFPTLRSGLGFVFSDFRIPASTLATLEVDSLPSIYGRLSARYGWQVQPPSWAYWRLILTQDIAGRPSEVLRGTALAFATRVPWHPLAYSGCYYFLAGNEEDLPVASACADSAVAVARRGGFWDGELETVARRLRAGAPQQRAP